MLMIMLEKIDELHTDRSLRLSIGEAAETALSFYTQEEAQLLQKCLLEISLNHPVVVTLLLFAKILPYALILLISIYLEKP